LNCRSDGVDGLQDFPRDFHVGKFQAEINFQRDDELQRVHRVQSQAVRSKQRLVIADFLRADLEHEIFHQHPFDLALEFRWIVHAK